MLIIAFNGYLLFLLLYYHEVQQLLNDRARNTPTLTHTVPITSSNLHDQLCALGFTLSDTLVFNSRFPLIQRYQLTTLTSCDNNIRAQLLTCTHRLGFWISLEFLLWLKGAVHLSLDSIFLDGSRLTSTTLPLLLLPRSNKRRAYSIRSRQPLSVTLDSHIRLINKTKAGVRFVNALRD